MPTLHPNLTAILNLSDGRSIELPVYRGALGDDAIGLKSLQQYGLMALDEGLSSTALCQSAITYIDGEQGILLHRGYPIDELALNKNYLEVAHLILYRELPNAEQLRNFTHRINEHNLIHEQIARLFNGFRRDSHPMAMMCAVSGSLAAFYHDMLDANSPEHQDLVAICLLAKMPTLAAMCYKYSVGQPFVYPNNKLSYAANFLHMMFAKPNDVYEINPIIERAMDRIFTLHIDHGQSASTSTFRSTASSGANPFACTAAAIASLWGAAHGGANEACLKMLQEIGTVERIPQFIARAKDKKDSFRLMGFGHRVYKNYDPRAVVMRQTCHEVLAELDINTPLFQVAKELEHIAVHDEYFVERKLYPNVDFYSGIILQAIGIPMSMFTVVFALARMVGWMANWKEMVADGVKIIRPSQLYVGETVRHLSK